MGFDELHRQDPKIVASKTYGKVINEIKAAWCEAFGSEMVIFGSHPRARFENVLDQLREKWAQAADKARLIEALDVEALPSLDDSIEDLIETVADDTFVRSVDDLTANQILAAIEVVSYEAGSDEGRVEMDMASFLKSVIRRIFVDNGIKGRINIGRNRHFPRLYQWLCEYVQRTEWDEGTGLKIHNISGRGRVARKSD